MNARLAAVVLVAAVATAGCGSSSSDDQKKPVLEPGSERSGSKKRSDGDRAGLLPAEAASVRDPDSADGVRETWLQFARAFLSQDWDEICSLYTDETLRKLESELTAGTTCPEFYKRIFEIDKREPGFEREVPRALREIEGTARELEVRIEGHRATIVQPGEKPDPYSSSEDYIFAEGRWRPDFATSDPQDLGPGQ